MSTEYGLFNRKSGANYKKAENMEKSKKIRKNLLTKVEVSDIMSKLSARTAHLKHRSVLRIKNFEKSRKKFLTQEEKCGKVRTRREGSERGQARGFLDEGAKKSSKKLKKVLDKGLRVW